MNDRDEQQGGSVKRVGRSYSAAYETLHAAPTTLHVTLNPLATHRDTRALASLCKHLNDTHTTYPGTNLTLHYSVNPQPNLA